MEQTSLPGKAYKPAPPPPHAPLTTKLQEAAGVKEPHKLLGVQSVQPPGSWFEKGDGDVFEGTGDGNPSDYEEVFGKGNVPTPDSLQMMYSSPSRGVTAEPDKIAAGWGKMRYSGDLMDDDGNKVGEFKRTFVRGDSGLQVHHDLFWIADDYEHLKGRGIGKDVTTKALRAYRDMSVTKVHVSTAKDGRVAWACMGFDWANEFERAGMTEGFHRFLRDRGYSNQDRAILGTAAKHAFTLASLEHDGEMLGREFLEDGPGWDGVLNLRDGDPGYEFAKRRLKL